MTGRLLPTLALALSVSACALPYVFKNGEATARIHVVDSGDITMCKDGTRYTLVPEPGTSYVQVPAQGRITVGRHMDFYGYPTSWSCYPLISFLPQPDSAYVMDLAVINNMCAVQVVKEDATKPTGVSFEKSLGPQQCFPDNIY